MNLIVVNQTKSRVPRQHLSRLLEFTQTRLIRRKVISKADREKDLTLVFLSRAKAKSLNMQFRGKAYATDVLSFEPMEPTSLGELIFCPEVLKKQASEHHLSYRDELAYMTLHGLLHLLGFEHENGGAEARQMFEIQDKLFDAFLKLK